ncbi:MAG: PilZ domain-containing protein [Bacteroidales bacterium]
MSSRSGAERRVWPRQAASACAWVIAARVRPGRDVRLIDLSRGGALIEGATRLLPGTVVDLQLVAEDARHDLRGKVLRSAVKALDHGGRVYYRAAVCFEHSFTECRADVSSSFPSAHAFGG